MTRTIKTPICIFLLSILFCCYASASGDNTKPVVRNGLIDLKNRDLARDGEVFLDGTWEYYQDRLLFPEDFARPIPPELTAFVEVPGFWNHYKINDKKEYSKGYATYRLKVIQLAGQQNVALGMPVVHTAYRLYINGDLLAQCGKVGDSAITSHGGICPQNPIFYLEDGSLELILQVSNYHHIRGGFWQSIALSDARAKVADYSQSVALDLFLIGTILIMGLYHIGLFSHRQKDQSNLFFGIFCLFIAMRSGFHNSAFFFLVFPEFSWETYLRLDYSTLYVPVIFFFLFFQRLYPREFHQKVLYLAICSSIVFGFITIITPTHFFSSLLFHFQVVILLACSYIMYVIVLATIRRREGAKVVLAGCIILTLCIVIDILVARAIINTIFISSAGLFLFIFAQAYVISRRFSNAFNTVELLSGRLEQKVKEQTAAISDLLDNTGQGIFSFDCQFRIQKYASNATHTIFEIGITGNHAIELMFPGEKETIKDYFDVIFESRGKLHLVKDLLPTELIRNKRFYEISYRWIKESKTTPARIMVILTDVTTKRKLEKMLEKDEQRNQKLVRVAADRYGFLRIVNRERRRALELRNNIREDPSQLDIDELLRFFHTIKGTTSSYGFRRVASIAHETESLLENKKLQKETEPGPLSQSIIQNLEKIEQVFQEELSELGDLIPKGLLAASEMEHYTISEEKVMAVEKAVQNGANKTEKIVGLLDEMRKQPLRDIMEKIAADARDLAFLMGKQVEVKLEGKEIRIIHAPFGKLFENLVHLVRNAVDHGIETPAVRAKKGKPETGQLLFGVSLENDQFQITFQDDGQGIDIEDVKTKALEKGLISVDESQSMEKGDFLNLIFKPGFSTSKHLTEISGRGIGMDSVLNSIRELGGEITTASERDKGTTFTITVPIP